MYFNDFFSSLKESDLFLGSRVARFFQGHKTTELNTENHQKSYAYVCQKTTKKTYFLEKKHQFIIFWVVAVPTGPHSQDITNNSKKLTQKFTATINWPGGNKPSIKKLQFGKTCTHDEINQENEYRIILLKKTWKSANFSFEPSKKNYKTKTFLKKSLI